jgi:hypothetical protein
MLTPALRCCEAARARTGPGDLMKAMILAPCFGDATTRDGPKRARELAQKAFKTELVPECEALAPEPAETPVRPLPAQRRTD